MRFIPLNFSKLSQIQLEVSQLIKLPSYENSRLYYPHDQFNKFLSIIPLREELEKLNLLENVLIIAVIVVDPGKRIPIHTDTGGYIHSLNIPISGYNQTFVNFYQPNPEHSSGQLVRPVGETLGHTYNQFDYQSCELIESRESNIPYIMDTQIPHDVINNSDTTRVFLLIRLDTNAYEKIWKSYGESNPACLDENQMS